MLILEADHIRKILQSNLYEIYLKKKKKNNVGEEEETTLIPLINGHKFHPNQFKGNLYP
jgi:hypothetical protein